MPPREAPGRGLCGTGVSLLEAPSTRTIYLSIVCTLLCIQKHALHHLYRRGLLCFSGVLPPCADAASSVQHPVLFLSAQPAHCRAELQAHNHCLFHCQFKH